MVHKVKKFIYETLHIHVSKIKKHKMSPLEKVPNHIFVFVTY